MINEYTINELKDILDRGAEIDFIYNKQKFSISQTNNGIHLTKHSEWENTQNYKNSDELIKNAIIDGNTFESICPNVKDNMWY